MPRHFSTAARTLLKFIWSGMNKDAEWENAARECIENNIKLPTIETAQVKGKPHKSKDPKEHVSMTLLNAAGTRITSVHVYKDGTGNFSKDKYN